MSARQVQDLLAPLRRRQREWAAGRLDDEPESEIRAQPLVLRLERDDPPSRAAALSAAAAASLAVLADPRSAPEQEWHEQCVRWLAGRIRKVARRARTSHWQAATQLPGVTVERDGAQVRAFPPYLIEDTPKELTRLQVSGTELPGPAEGGDAATGQSGETLRSAATLGFPPTPRFPATLGFPATLWFPAEVPMSAGKAMAQAGHAAMLLATYLPEPALDRWLADGLPVRIRVASAQAWKELTAGPTDPEQRWAASGSVLVRDAGFTEVEPGTVTVAALLPGVDAEQLAP